ncbi:MULTISPECIES: hybrid sensor histidine kinase/response regulator [unclassified Agarivorans]|uniref:hybrid sensor histidine kinase/response regulator n=1 Tax=unclassified Agarivorans TaxID=2636026 RepID=UPI0026E38A27|nr:MULTISPECIES: hybrid sensor histidine kinase/response regulator [unclassified Agarivorans]MDO6686761.1 hybrid sensor histidine kinase/response regulator [Agarivorans sp. 3_MG-2023]MDO6716509.1 hybrid sensor histidine kinase/response regulator [Agarivorans sp. 2_MG-2023]
MQIVSEGWLVIPLSLAYLGLLFVIAYYTDQNSSARLRWQPAFYSFSIAVYCTSWTFYGTVGQASENFLSFIPIYLGPVLLFIFGWKLLARVVLIAKREHITTIADFIAARYGKSQTLAVVISLICIIGVLPYIALQLRAIVMGLDLFGGEAMREAVGKGSSSQIALFVSIALAIFTMLFGTRHIDATEHHRGVIVAIAFESLVKLVAFVCVGLLAVSILWDLPLDAQQAVGESFTLKWQEISFADVSDLIVATLLAMSAVICLPRQFHVTVVENNQVNDLKTARWLFPTYLVLLAIFVLPIAFAGDYLLPSNTPADNYVISLPLAAGQNILGMVAFLGGTSAASGMVVVSTIALAIMVSNDLVLPLLLKQGGLSRRNFAQFSELLLNVRRTTILVILLLAWGTFLMLGEISNLADIGFLSFAAIAQLAIPLIFGLYWREGNRTGVYAGLLVGMSLWLLNLLNMTDSLNPLIFNQWIADWLSAPQLQGHALISNQNWGILLSLLGNLSAYILISKLSSPAVSEWLQASNFVGQPGKSDDAGALYQSKVSVEELHMLASRFLGTQRISDAFGKYATSRGVELNPNQQAPVELIAETERMLGGVFGSSSARLVLGSALQGKQVQLEEFASIAEEASELLQFNKHLLQGAIEHIDQGIAIVDQELKLVSWNRRYTELFDFPNGMISVGRPIEDLIRHNAVNGLCGPGDIEEHVERRVEHLRRGNSHTSSRIRRDGRVIQVQGNPMPNGGYVMTFSDITTFRQAEDMLKQANEILEARVAQRTQQLSSINQQLVHATSSAEQANQSKTRFLAAVSHDLMQPLNAAKLFTGSLLEAELEKEAKFLAASIDKSLYSAEEIISDLLDISRLESGRVVVSTEQFEIGHLLDHIHAEFIPLAQQQGVALKLQASKLTVRSDSKLLRRILQNFLTNALRYNPNGKVLLGGRRKGNNLRLEVWDNGPGIEESKQQQIFEEFQQLQKSGRAREEGLGLGLAIAQGFAELLEIPIGVESVPGKGSVFYITVPVVEALNVHKQVKPEGDAITTTQGARVLCIDNEPDILVGMESLLSRWGYEVICCEDADVAEEVIDGGWVPELILSDYHLDFDKTGLEALQRLIHERGLSCHGIVISADRQTDLIDRVRAQGFAYLSKPLRPLRLKKLCQQLLNSKTAANYWLMPNT